MVFLQKSLLLLLSWWLVDGCRGQVPASPVQPGWEALHCDSTQRVGGVSLYDLTTPFYTRNGPALPAATGQITAVWRAADGSVEVLGGFPEKPPGQTAYQTALLSTLLPSPTYLYERWDWLLGPTRAVFLQKRDSLVRQLQAEYSGHQIRVISDLRTADKQTVLMGQGYSMAPISFHQLGLAADVGILREGRLMQNLGPYARIGELTPRYGLTWGGNFVGFVDVPHFQLYYNAAALLRDFPQLRTEFEPFYEHYLGRVRSKIREGKAFEVLDTQALLSRLNEYRLLMPCTCTPAAGTPTPALPGGLLPRAAGRNVVLFGDALTQTLTAWQDGRRLAVYRLGTWQ